MKFRTGLWPSVVPLCLLTGGCTALRQNGVARNAARAVLAARAYDDFVIAQRNDDEVGIERASQRYLKAAPHGRAALAPWAYDDWVTAARNEDNAGMERAARQYVKVAPDEPAVRNPYFLNQVGYMLADEGETPHDFQLAEAYTRRAVQLYDEAEKRLDDKADLASVRVGRAMTRDSLAWALYKRGKLDEAEKQQREAIREARATKSLSGELPLHLGDILAAQGKNDEARAAYKEALKLRSGEPDVRQRAEKGLSNLE